MQDVVQHVFPLLMTPVAPRASALQTRQILGMGIPVMADSRAIWSNSLPEVSPPTAARTAAGTYRGDAVDSTTMGRLSPVRGDVFLRRPAGSWVGVAQIGPQSR